MKNIDSLKQQLNELATIVNAFKSEAVQLKVLEFLLESGFEASEGRDSEREAKVHRGKQAKGTKTRSDLKKLKSGRSLKKGRPSAAQILDQLLQSGFFNKKRTIAEIISHTGSKMGFHYKANELSPPLLRFIRDGKLDREKNAESQFEYFKK
jgi:hypothetical protein